MSFQCIAHLLKSGVSKLENVNNANQSPVGLDNGQVEVVTICTQCQPETWDAKSLLTVHLLQRILHDHGRRSSVRVRSHDPYH